ncbi:WD repeat and SOF domain-containing protein 1 [Actinidia rufa]|uniref:DDB1- and CUL4-associated factor 13 n=1 Tax=Actinidia rufa TaxID=165716 RepID=A0A7J0DGN9_9ERIC|nr:WD repeat and SOF domain-containing protein 1 [Actinidia rufa]
MFAFGTWLPVFQFRGHQGAVRGLTASTDGRILVSCGTDCTVRLWNVPLATVTDSDDSSDNSVKPLAVYVLVIPLLLKYDVLRHFVSFYYKPNYSSPFFRAVDHQWNGDLFATAGAQVDIWDHNRSQPVNSFEWGKDTVISVRFNPGEPNVLATSARMNKCSKPCKLPGEVSRAEQAMSWETAYGHRTKTNSIAWNPMEPMNFTAANEDCSCYSYDARKLDEARCVHKDHVSAVMDIDYSPTGREFVTGSYDRTVRIFQFNAGHSREVYHTKRMQSCDGSYVISGSDDTNLRIWKAKASEQLGVLLPRERRNQEYLEAVKNRYKHLPEVKRIVRHRHLPKPIYKASALRRIMTEAERKKEERRRAHSAPGSMPRVPLRKKRIIKEIE